MTYRELMEWVNTDPFVPFRIYLSDNRHIDIHHSSMLWPGRRTALVGIPDDPNEPDVPSLHESIVLRHIVSIKLLKAVTASG